MVKTRILLFLLTIIVVGTGAYFAVMYARGFRLNPDDGKLEPHGILVAKSNPDSAEIYLNGELEGATNSTLTLPPSTFDVEIKKEGYITWRKRITISEEEVTEITATLFKGAPNLSAITFFGATKPISTSDMGKIAYAVLPNSNGENMSKIGLWVMETVNLPIGFTRDPRQVTDGNLTGASWIWSPDGRDILLSTANGAYLLDAGVFTPQSQRVNIIGTKDDLLEEWDNESRLTLQNKLKKLPTELESIFERKTSKILFSPDEDMIVYTASGSATIPNDLIKPLPGSSTQKQDRELSDGNTYVYDVKEDRNFLVDGDAVDLVVGDGATGEAVRKLMWFPTSRHLVLAEPEKITVMDYDCTNRQVIYQGSYISPFAFSLMSQDRLLILTNLGASDKTPNLYYLTIK